MYENLVKSLRETRERIRKYPSIAMYIPPYQLTAAADAIEELSIFIENKYSTEENNISSERCKYFLDGDAYGNSLKVCMATKGMPTCQCGGNRTKCER